MAFSLPSPSSLLKLPLDPRVLAYRELLTPTITRALSSINIVFFSTVTFTLLTCIVHFSHLLGLTSFNSFHIFYPLKTTGRLSKAHRLLKWGVSEGSFVTYVSFFFSFCTILLYFLFIVIC